MLFCLSQKFFKINLNEREDICIFIVSLHFIKSKDQLTKCKTIQYKTKIGLKININLSNKIFTNLNF